MLDGLADALVAFSQGMAALAEELFRSFYRSIRLLLGEPIYGRTRLDPRHILISLWPILAFVLCIFSGCLIVDQVLTNHVVRKEETLNLVQVEADRLWNRVDVDGRPQALQPGDIPKRDSWGEEIELRVDRVKKGDQVTVRSPGPDKEFGTMDDIVAIRRGRNQAEAVGEELFGRLLDVAKKHAEDKLKELKE